MQLKQIVCSRRGGQSIVKVEGLETGGETRYQSVLLRCAEIWDPSADMWSPLPMMHEHRMGAAFAVLPSGRFAVFGGLGILPGSKQSDQPDTHWAAASRINGGNRRCLFEHGSRLFTNYENLEYRENFEGVRADAECFNPMTESWEPLEYHSGELVLRRQTARALLSRAQMQIALKKRDDARKALLKATDLNLGDKQLEKEVEAAYMRLGSSDSDSDDDEGGDEDGQERVQQKEDGENVSANSSEDECEDTANDGDGDQGVSQSSGTFRRMFATATAIPGGLLVLGGLENAERHVRGSPHRGFTGRGGNVSTGFIFDEDSGLSFHVPGVDNSTWYCRQRETPWNRGQDPYDDPDEQSWAGGGRDRVGGGLSESGRYWGIVGACSFHIGQGGLQVHGSHERGPDKHATLT